MCSAVDICVRRHPQHVHLSMYMSGKVTEETVIGEIFSFFLVRGDH